MSIIRLGRVLGNLQRIVDIFKGRPIRARKRVDSERAHERFLIPRIACPVLLFMCFLAERICGVRSARIARDAWPTSLVATTCQSHVLFFCNLCLDCKRLWSDSLASMKKGSSIMTSRLKIFSMIFAPDCNIISSIGEWHSHLVVSTIRI